MENKIIAAALASREAFSKLQDLDVEPSMSDAGKLLLENIASFYKQDKDAKKVDVELYLHGLEQEYPKHYNSFKDIVNSCTDIEIISIPNLIRAVKLLKKHNLAMQVASALTRKDYDTADIIIDDYQSLEVNGEDEEETHIHEGISLDFLKKATDPKNKIRLWPTSINERCDGGAVRGNHILIFARPETGKSLFAINMAAMMCKDGHKVLYVGNEDPEDSMRMRFLSRFTDLNKLEILADPAKAVEIGEKAGSKNLIFVGKEAGTIKEINGLIERYRPDVLFVDQIRNLKFHNVDGLVVVLERAATEVRNLAKRHNILAISVTQAGDSATNKLVLDMNDVDSSKTGLPAQLDVMIGVGMNGQYEKENKRMVSLPKNKLGPHEFFQVTIDPSISKVRRN